jgi:tol-pal system protein YbgF
MSALLLTSSTLAQQRGSGNFLDDLFNRGEPQSRQAAPGGRASDPGDLSVRLDRMESALRQLTGTIEQLQYRNQQLEMQLKRLQDERGGPAPPAQVAPMGPGNAPMAPGRRSDVFDPAQQPNAPGAPRTLGNEAVITALDLSTLSGNNPTPPQAAVPPGAVASTAPTPVPTAPPAQVRPAVPSAGSGQRVATLPPSASPQDEYDMAYGYVLHKDYGLAEQSFRDYLKKYPNERLVPEAHYWLGESLFQQQRYRDAAESFLGVSTKFERSAKAPDALLRLGQSLAAMNQKEAACATLAEVGRKFPRASVNVKRGVEQEQKRVHC